MTIFPKKPFPTPGKEREGSRLKKKITVRQAEAILIVLLLLAVLLPRLIGETEIAASGGSILTMDDMNGCTFAAAVGSEDINLLHDRFPLSEIRYVSDGYAMADAVNRGEADAFLAAGSAVEEVLAANRELTAYPIPLKGSGENAEERYILLRRSDCGYHTTDMAVSDVTEDMTIAVMTGADPGMILRKLYPNATYLEFTSLPEIYFAVSSGKADVGTTYADNFRSVQENYENLAFVRGAVTYLDYTFAMQKTPEGEALRDEYNAFIARIRESGEYDRIIERWQSDDPAEQVMPEYTFSGEKGTLKLCTCGTWEPMTYYVGSELTGELVELATAFCADCGYIPEFSVLPFPSQITGLLSGEFDMLVDCVCATPEREESVALTEPYYNNPFYLLTVTEEDSGSTTVSKASVFLSDLKTSFEKNFVRESRWQMLLSGLGVTVALSVLAGVFGSLLGAGICALRMSKNSFAAGFARIYIKLIRSTPVVVLLMVLYYVVFGDTDLRAFWVCAIGFALDFAAYSAEIFRSGVEAVPEGQHRAAKALGFSPVKAFRKVVLPQAVVHILPVFSGQFIATVKLTSVAGYITVQDLTKVSDIIRTRTYEAFFPLISTAVIYFAISSLLVSLLKVAERRLDPMKRSRTVKGVNVRAD